MSKEKTVNLVEKSNSTNLGYQPTRRIVNDGYQPSEVRGFQPTSQSTTKPLPNVVSSVQTVTPAASTNTSQTGKSDK